MNDGRFACWLTIGAALAAGCSDRKLNLDDEIVSNSSEDPGLLDPSSRWDCPSQSIPETQPVPTEVHYIVPIVDAVRTDRAPPELQIQACLVLDGNCDEPVPTQVTKTDLTRPELVQISLPYAFDGYLRLTAPGYAMTTYYVGRPLIGGSFEVPPLPGDIEAFEEARTIRGRPIEMLRSETLAQIYSDFGLLPDPTTGTLMVRTTDCFGILGDGVRLELPGAPNAWVARNGFITRSDGVLATDSTGMGGFLNVTPGVVRIDGSVLDACVGEDCGSSEPSWRVATSVVTRVAATAVTLVEMRADDSSDER